MHRLLWRVCAEAGATLKAEPKDRSACVPCCSGGGSKGGRCKPKKKKPDITTASRHPKNHHFPPKNALDRGSPLIQCIRQTQDPFPGFRARRAYVPYCGTLERFGLHILRHQHQISDRLLLIRMLRRRSMSRKAGEAQRFSDMTWKHRALTSFRTQEAARIIQYFRA